MVVTCSRDCVFSRMIAGFVKGFLRIGLSLLSTILTLVLVSFLSPYVSDALMKHTPAQDVLEKKIVEAFMPEFSADDLLKANLSGTPLENLMVDQIKSLSESGGDKLGITATGYPESGRRSSKGYTDP